METTNTVANEAVETKAVETKVEKKAEPKKAVKRVAPKKAIAKAEKKPEKKAEPKKKAEAKPAEKKPEKAPILSLRQEGEQIVAKLKFEAPLQIRMYAESDGVADKERDVPLEIKEKNPFATSVARVLTEKNLIVANSSVPISETDKSHRNSIWECKINRTGATLMLGETLYNLVKTWLKEGEYTYKYQSGWDLKHLVTIPKANAVAVCNRLNTAYLKLATKAAK